jgi:hypothetical protein
MAITQSVSVFAQASFSAKTDFTTGTLARSVSIGDLNGDGKNDMAVANYSSATVSVFLNTTSPGAATPAFSAKTDFTTGNYPYSVSIGDFNGDGKNDMAVANWNSTSVSVFLNTTAPGAATPTFSAKRDFTTGNGPNSVSIGDFNGDGKNDMAVLNYSSANVSVFINTTSPGAATPAFSAKTDFATGSLPYSVSIGDFNGDGRNDMAVANYGSNTVSVFLNTTAPGAATPAFSAKTDFTAGIGSISVSIVDFNGDGKNDMAVANNGSNNVSVFLNTAAPGAATPSFSAKTDFTTGVTPFSVVTGDFNGDGKNDIAVANYSSNNVSVLLNTTSPGAAIPAFSAKTDFATGTGPCSVSIGDFNGDGKNDMAVANSSSNTVSVLLNITPIGVISPSFSAKRDFTTGDNPYSISIDDLNGDGKKDMAIANQGSNTVSVFLNTTTPGAIVPTLSIKTDFITGSHPTSVCIGDVNGDGKPDLVVVNDYSSSVSVLLNTTTPGATTPTFSAKTDFTTVGMPISVSISDLNGDGMPDLAVAGGANTVSVLLNTTTPGAVTPTFSTKTDFTTGNSPAFVFISDLNGDGKPDIAVPNSSSNSISILINTTTPGATVPTFSAKTDFTTGTNPCGVSISDLNGDGKPDLAVPNMNSSSVSVLLNTTSPGSTTPSFTTRTDFTTGSNPMSVSIGDLNGDGKPDLVVTNLTSTYVSVFLNTTVPGATTPTFSDKTNFTAGNSPIFVFISDLNGDGKNDMAVANSSSNTVSVLLNAAILPLPVELTSFTASINGSTVILNWQTATEVNNYGFEIERRIVNGEQTVNTWQKIGSVAGNGTSNTQHNYSYTDNNATTGSYVYRLKQIDNDGTFKYSQSVEVTAQVPAQFALEQNYPNPFNPSTTFHFALPVAGDVKLVILNILGQEVAEVVNKHLAAGTYDYSWNAKNLSSGIYFFKLTTNQFSSVRKMMLLK